MQDIINWINNTYKENIPANARMYIKQFVNPSKITENNFSQKELEVLKKTQQNSQKRASGKESKQLYNDIKNIPLGSAVRLINNGKTSIAPVEALMEQVSPSIQYPDYGQQNTAVANIGNKSAKRSVSGSPYSLATTLGRAFYDNDAQGNTHIKDTYNFNPNPDKFYMDMLTKKNGNWDVGYTLARYLGDRLGTSMPVDINLRDTMEKH